MACTQKHIRDYCRSALAKGYLADEEHAQVSAWLPLHPDYEPHWKLCQHGQPNQQGGYGLCVFGDDKHWLTSYHNLKAGQESVERKRLMTACRQAVRPSRDAFLAAHPLGCVADHANPGGFEAIVEAFVADHGAPTVEYLDGDWRLDPARELLFREYHDARVEWQSLSPEDHRRATRDRHRTQ